MKVLLISDVPPCDDFTAGIVLSALVRFLPRGSICCFAVVNPLIPFRMSSEFSGIPVEFHEKPLENWSWLPQGFPLGRLSSLASLAGETYTGRQTGQIACRQSRRVWPQTAGRSCLGGLAGPDDHSNGACGGRQAERSVAHARFGIPSAGGPKPTVSTRAPPARHSNYSTRPSEEVPLSRRLRIPWPKPIGIDFPSRPYR